MTAKLMASELSYYHRCMATLERALKASGPERDLLLNEAVRLHRLALEHDGRIDPELARVANH